ncbi:MAG TPA: MipA/OmpV family protein [Steroidobacteraceae bacterium]|nr:MipA/OmpV family protein [Steroidobacteraceae bacterium]
MKSTNGMYTLRLSLVIASCIAAAHATFAATTCNTPSDECAAIGHWNLSIGIGYGLRTNPILSGSDIPLVIVPKVSYYGKRFFLDNLDVGFTLYENDDYGFNFIATPGYDRVFFARYDPQNFFAAGAGGSPVSPPGGPPPTPPPPATPPPKSDAERILERSRQVTYLVGPEWHFDFHSLTGQFDFLYEATGRHHGTEARVALAVPLIKSHGVLKAAAGGTWKSGALITYYYGEKGIYEAGSAFSPFAKLSYTRAFTGHWGLDIFAHYEWLGDTIKKSPIVVDHQVTTYFAGVTYSF